MAIILCFSNWTLYSAHQSNKHRLNLKWQSCSQGAQLLGVIFGWLRRPKLAKKLRFYVARKKSGHRYYAITVVKLLSSCLSNTATMLVALVLCTHCLVGMVPTSLFINHNISIHQTPSPCPATLVSRSGDHGAELHVEHDDIPIPRVHVHGLCW